MSATIHPFPRAKPPVGFDHRLRVVRIEYGRMIGRDVGQREFASLIGVKEGTYAGYEKGPSKPRDIVGFCRRVEEVTGYDAGWLAGLDGHDTDPGTPSDLAGQSSPCMTDVIDLASRRGVEWGGRTAAAA